MNTKVKGNNAELEALAFFKRQGYSVSLPFGDNDPYDLIVESPSKCLYRVQVRWLSWKKNGAAELGLRQTGRLGKKARRLDLTRIEAFVGWDGETAFVIPVSVIGERRAAFSLRREVPKNGQRQGVHLAETFKEALHLIP